MSDSTTSSISIVEPVLNETQQEVYDAIMAGKSIFLTGCAGTGKSFLLAKVIKDLKAKKRIGTNKPWSVYITATTGIAAVPFGGSTIHSFAGIATGSEPVEYYLKKVDKNKFLKDRWKEVDTLMIDEISMMDGALFDKLERIARVTRHQSEPFGGIQIILTGDFLQMPPVNPVVGFAFQGDAWAITTGFNNSYQLTHVYRQADVEFTGILAELRLGIFSDKARSMLNKCVGRSFKDRQEIDGIEPTLLYSTKTSVAEQNNKRLAQLTTPLAKYKVHNECGDKKQMDLEALCRNSPCYEELDIRVGAQVILITNLSVEKGLANGSRGVVTRFITENDEICRLYPRSFAKVNGDLVFPVVRFVNGMEEIIKPAEWKTEIKGIVVARRIQVPLILGYAITIHKCQGMTLDRVIVDLGNVFEYGQAYVALSRARSIDELSLLKPPEPSFFRAHPKAKAFYENFASHSSSSSSQS